MPSKNKSVRNFFALTLRHKSFIIGEKGFAKPFLDERRAF